MGVGALLGRDRGVVDVGVAVEDRADLGRDAVHGQAIGTVRGDLAVQDRVRDAGVVGVGDAQRGVGGQDDDAVMVRAQAELTGGAVHAEGLDAAELGLLDLEVARQHGTDHGDDDLVALLEVLCAADDLQRDGVALVVDVLVADADLAQPHVVGVGVGLLGDDLAGHDVVEVGADLLDGLDLGAGADELAGEDRGVVGQVDHALEPFIRDAHCDAFLGLP